MLYNIKCIGLFPRSEKNNVKLREYILIFQSRLWGVPSLTLSPGSPGGPEGPCRPGGPIMPCRGRDGALSQVPALLSIPANASGQQHTQPCLFHRYTTVSQTFALRVSLWAGDIQGPLCSVPNSSSPELLWGRQPGSQGKTGIENLPRSSPWGPSWFAVLTKEVADSRN